VKSFLFYKKKTLQNPTPFEPNFPVKQENSARENETFNFFYAKKVKQKSFSVGVGK